jgi:hypothetical protein
MLLLDSKLDGWLRVKGRIEQKADADNNGKIKAILDNVIKPILYPACIQNAPTPAAV